MHTMPHRLKAAKRRLVGAKQTLKALQSGGVEAVYIARDAEDRVVGPIESICRERQIEVVWIDTMEKLGALCGIDVGAASAVILL